MRVLFTVALLLIPLALAGDILKIWADIEEELREKMAAMDKSHKADAEEDSEEPSVFKDQQEKGWGDVQPKGWGDDKQKGWGDDTPKGWGDDTPKGWGDDTPKGWGDDTPKGWGDDQEKDDDKREKKHHHRSHRRSSDDGDEQDKNKNVDDNADNTKADDCADDVEKDNAKDSSPKVQKDDKKEKRHHHRSHRRSSESDKNEDNNGDDNNDDMSSNNADVEEKPKGSRKHNGFKNYRARGWEDDHQSRHNDDVEDDNEDDKDVKMSEAMREFKEFIKRKAMKVNEEREMKKELYKQMERIQLKKWLAAQLEKVTEEFSKHRMSFVLETTGQFLSLCQESSGAKSILERLESGHFAEPSVSVQKSNTTDFMMNFTLGNFSQTPMNSSFPQMRNSTASGDAKIKMFMQMEGEERVRYVLHNYVTIMCDAADDLTKFIKSVESHLIACKQGLARC